MSIRPSALSVFLHTDRSCDRVSPLVRRLQTLLICAIQRTFAQHVQDAPLPLLPRPGRRLLTVRTSYPTWQRKLGRRTAGHHIHHLLPHRLAGVPSAQPARDLETEEIGQTAGAHPYAASPARLTHLTTGGTALGAPAPSVCQGGSVGGGQFGLQGSHASAAGCVCDQRGQFRRAWHGAREEKKRKKGGSCAG